MMTPTELLAWREAKRWTQEQAAEALGYKRRGYQALESGARTITRTIYLAVIGCDADRKPVRSLRGLTNGDLSDEDNIRQAEHELRRATTDAALADWARRWGECAIERLHAALKAEDDHEGIRAQWKEERDEGDREINTLSDTIRALKDAARQAVYTEGLETHSAAINALEALL